MRVLGIESSCDDTAAAVYDSAAGLLSNVVASQVPVHETYGGVVPELASREHIRSIVPVVEQALGRAASEREEIDGVAATAGPGLIGSLLVGLCFAKSLAFAWRKPIFGVDHLEAHLFAIFLEGRPDFPYIALLVSGGHTSLFRVEGFDSVAILGGTRDDAAGEAFDKAAKQLGLGYPGGVAIDHLARQGDPLRYPFPRAWLSPGSSDFSFSGLKTSCGPSSPPRMGRPPARRTSRHRSRKRWSRCWRGRPFLRRNGKGSRASSLREGWRRIPG
jgi:N6-L-threonylcarbamoyladenine synthase